MQRWGLNRLAHASRPGLYRVHEAFDISGSDTDPDALVLAWQHLAEHHPALRSSLHVHGDRAWQVPHRNVRVTLHREDTRGTSDDRTAPAMAAHLKDLRSRAVGAAEPGHVELALFRGDHATRLVWSFSYLHVDGWSFPHLLQDLFTLHDALRAGHVPALPARPSPGDLAPWALEDEQAARVHWRAELAGKSTGSVAALLGPASGPAEQADLRTWLSREETSALRAALRGRGLTLHTAVQAAYALVLAALAETDDVLFGTVVAGRSTAGPGAEDVVGCLNNVLPSRVRIPRAERADAWLRRLQNRHAESAVHERTSPLDVQRWSGVPDSGRLYDSQIVVENFPFDAALQSRVAGWGQLANGAHGDEALRLTVWPDPALLIKVGYHRDLVSDAGAAGLLHRVAAVLTALAVGLDGPTERLAAVARRPAPTAG
jgi:hypothetical protein